jgi:predicted Zn-dependent peptidase
VLPAIITDFKKQQEQDLETNPPRVSKMREAFLAFEKWDHKVGMIERMEKITKADIVRVANKYFGKDLVSGWRVDGQHEVPKIEKPPIDKIDIDPSRQSEFARRVLAMPFEPLEIQTIEKGKDYLVSHPAPGVTLYTAPNPMNSLFSLTFSVDTGTDHSPTLATASMLLQKAGTPRFNNIDLQKEWYKLGTDINGDVGDAETYVTISGLDENTSASLALLMDLMAHPRADQATLDELVNIILARREDSKKEPQSVHRALLMYNRLDNDSPFLRLLPSDKMKALKAAELLKEASSLLDFKCTIEYTGPRSTEDVQSLLAAHLPMRANPKDPPSYWHKEFRKPEKNEIYFFDKEVAQSQIRIEFESGKVNEKQRPEIEVYNDYFAGGMSGVVFQEIRESRALAYAAGALFATGERKGDENLMIGAMGTQVDKSPEAVRAFIDILDHLPASEDRHAETIKSLENTYRGDRIGFRSVIASARQWERLGLDGDPRLERYNKIKQIALDDLLDFHKSNIAGRPKLISILGDSSKIDMEALKKFGTIKRLTIDDLFVK